jgi:hypothetical protein
MKLLVRDYVYCVHFNKFLYTPFPLFGSAESEYLLSLHFTTDTRHIFCNLKEREYSCFPIRQLLQGRRCKVGGGGILDEQV